MAAQGGPRLQFKSKLGHYKVKPGYLGLRQGQYQKGRKFPFTRKLTEEIGHPKLRARLASVTTIMKLSDRYDDFQLKPDRIHPRY